MELHESQKAWMKVVAKAWSDAAFKARLLAEPAAVLKEKGIAIPEGMTIKVLEDTATMAHLILPEQPAELSEADLEQLAAGQVKEGGGGYVPYHPTYKLIWRPPL